MSGSDGSNSRVPDKKNVDPVQRTFEPDESGWERDPVLPGDPEETESIELGGLVMPHPDPRPIFRGALGSN